MPNFALHDGFTALNVIVAESQEAAENLTGLYAVETSNVPWIGWTLHGDVWRPPMPSHGLWEWDDNAGEWVDVTPETNAEEDAG
jgi:hypothetical protein